MNTKKNASLEQIPANRNLIEMLYKHGKLTSEAKQYALNLIEPRPQWCRQISDLLLIIGSPLMLGGILYCMIALTQLSITPKIQLLAVGSSVIGCLIGSCFYTLQRKIGQIFLISASLLTGLFISGFNIIYHIGADSYQLFMAWSILTFGWTLKSNFPLQWLFWLVITNLCMMSFEYHPFIIMTIFNSTVLALREYLAYEWLKTPWTRTALTINVLLTLQIPIILWIHTPNTIITISIILNIALSLMGHSVIYGLYRYKLPDIKPITAVVISGCLIAEIAAFKMLVQNMPTFLLSGLIGLIMLIILYYAVHYLRAIAKKIEGHDV